MRRILSRGILSVEEEALDPKPADVTQQDVAVAEAGHELAEAVIEQTESEVEGEVREVELAETGEIVEALESLHMLAYDSSKGQGFSRETAAAVSMQYEYFRRKLGDRQPSKMPSLESFGATSSRIRGTVASMEEIGDMAKRAWKAIVDKVKAAFKWIRDHFLKVFGSAERLQKRADALKEKADNIKGDFKNDKTFENEALSKKLYISNAIGDGAAIGTQASTFSNVVSAFLTHAYGQAGVLEQAIEAGLKSATAGTDFKSNIDKPTNFDESKAPASRKTTKPDGVVVTGSAELPGGKVIVAMTPDVSVTGAAALNALAATKAVIDSVEGTKAPTSYKFATLDRGQAVKIADDISKLAGYLVQSRKSVDDVNKKRDALERVIDSFVREFEKADTDTTAASGTAAAGNGGTITADAKKTNATAAKKVVGRIPTIIDFGASSVMAYAINTSSAYLDYVEQSLRLYKED